MDGSRTYYKRWNTDNTDQADVHGYYFEEFKRKEIKHKVQQPSTRAGGLEGKR
jgi:hypothetical protein